MRVVLKPDHLIAVAETDAERGALQTWSTDHAGHVFFLMPGPSEGATLRDLGPREEACREPINIVYDACAPQWQPISNLAPTPFEFDGRRYASVEAFWQGLKSDDDAERRRIAGLAGKEAKNAAPRDWPLSFAYEGQTVQSGTHPHWKLMRRACQAKFTQNPQARAALLATGTRPLTHMVRRDSRTIPGVLMADIWMRIRSRLDRKPS